jgi:transcriptional regulator with XRE-family HTH domain
MEAKKLVGWNIRRLRVARGMTIEHLAGEADIGASYLAQLERGEVNVGVVILDRVAKVLAAKLADLVVEPAPGAKPPKPLPAGRKRK